MYFLNDFVQRKSIAYKQKAQRTLIKKKFKSKANMQQNSPKTKLQTNYNIYEGTIQRILIQSAKQDIPCSLAP